MSWLSEAVRNKGQGEPIYRAEQGWKVTPVHMFFRGRQATAGKLVLELDSHKVVEGPQGGYIYRMMYLSE